jgi:hypothetical protein
MRLSDFHVYNDHWPLVTTDDELIVVHRNQLSVQPVMFIGAHSAAVVPIRAAANRSAVETATPWTTLTLQTGGFARVNLTDGTNPLDMVSKIQPTSGRIFVAIVSPIVFDAYFKQFATTP